MRRLVVRLLAVVATPLLLASVLSSCGGGGGGGYQIEARFTRAVGLYPGSPVRVLGIDVGEIADIQNVEDYVEVTLDLKEGTELPADAVAVIVPVTTLGERYVQLGPVYERGAKLESGSTIPLSRTQVPVEIDELLRSLEGYFGEIEPANATELIESLATLLEGQGDELNDLFENAAGTFDILADKSGELGDIIDALAELTGTLSTRTDAIEELVRSYDVVSGVLADNRENLSGTITGLDRAAFELSELLTRHNQPLQDDIEVLTTVGRTLQRNIDRFDVILRETVRLFAAADRAYDPRINMLPLNNQDEERTTSELYFFRLRDRVAGVCRRLIAQDPTLATTHPQVVACAANDNDVLNSIIGIVPGLAGQGGEGEGSSAEEPPPPPPGPPPPPSPEELFLQALDALSALLNPDQLAAASFLSQEQLDVLLFLTPEQNFTLSTLTPEQVVALRDVPPEQIPAYLDNIALGAPPSTLLDQPLLPPPGAGGGFIDRAVGGAGGLVGGLVP